VGDSQRTAEAKGEEQPCTETARSSKCPEAFCDQFGGSSDTQQFG
jgi:hypothetical protein